MTYVYSLVELLVFAGSIIYSWEQKEAEHVVEDAAR